MNMQNMSEYEKEALKFLECDFNQSFQQIRHYDSQIFDILKFTFTGYTTLISVALGLYQFGLKEHIYFKMPLIAILSIGFLIGLFMFVLALQNRVYFVRVVRYLNEQRELFLQYKPLGFENKSNMYTDYKQPVYFNWRSSQAWLCYIMTALNSILLGVILFILFNSNYYKWIIITISGFGLFIIQMLIAVLYLKSQDEKL